MMNMGLNCLKIIRLLGKQPINTDGTGDLES